MENEYHYTKDLLRIFVPVEDYSVVLCNFFRRTVSSVSLGQEFGPELPGSSTVRGLGVTRTGDESEGYSVSGR